MFGFEWHIIDTVCVGVKIIVQVLNIKLTEDLLSREWKVGHFLPEQ